MLREDFRAELGVSAAARLSLALRSRHGVPVRREPLVLSSQGDGES